MAPSAKKLSPQQQRTLLQKYKICIEGPVRARDWPEKYSSIFSLVRDTERIRYDDYIQTDLGSDPPRLLQVSQMCARVERLVSQAYSLRVALANEDTWRLKLEHLILERFESEVDWRVTQSYGLRSDPGELTSKVMFATNAAGFQIYRPSHPVYWRPKSFSRYELLGAFAVVKNL
ncbi:hypothetical protein BJY01DRAFT_125691 [Aspergillus pseudoustus]|uniref:Uncharacterized protein n=1 Tax=Aspergillus pseudoustus TaxID=1810923 RepID=A0ABR4KHF2_9EURO